MRAVLQRVARASVDVDGTCVGRIERGWLILLGVAQGDTEEDAAWMAEKVLNLRGFEDDAGKMNRSVARRPWRHSGRQPVHAAGRLPRGTPAEFYGGGRSGPCREALSRLCPRPSADRVLMSPPAFSAP